MNFSTSLCANVSYIYTASSSYDMYMSMKKNVPPSPYLTNSQFLKNLRKLYPSVPESPGLCLPLPRTSGRGDLQSLRPEDRAACGLTPGTVLFDALTGGGDVCVRTRGRGLYLAGGLRARISPVPAHHLAEILQGKEEREKNRTKKNLDDL